VAGDWLRRHPGLLTLQIAGRPVTGDEAGLSSPAWEDVPAYGRHVVICRGPRCTARGSALTAVALAERLRDHGLGDHEVLVAQSGCLYPCNHAPVVVVQPDGQWWGPVSPADARLLVDSWADDRRGPIRHSIEPPRP
jgi:(2Fe-2S) ferredoxin